MTSKEAESVGRKVLKYLPPEYTCRGALVFSTPIGSILRGICLEASGWNPKEFYARIFAQPTYIVAKHECLNLGRRIGGGAHAWNTEVGNWEEQISAALTREALPILARINAPLDVVEAAEGLRVTADGTVKRIIAYSYARAGCQTKACELLRELELRANRTVKWQADNANEARILRETLISEPTKAQALLQANEEKTIANLKLQKYYRTSVCEP